MGSEHNDRRGRWVDSIRRCIDPESAAVLLDAYAALVTPPGLLSEIEQLPDWDPRTLLQWALDRAPTPNYGAKVLHAQDLLDGRQRQLAGWLSEAAEQAYCLGDGATATALGRLSNEWLVRCVGEPALKVAFGAESDEPGDA